MRQNTEGHVSERLGAEGGNTAEVTGGHTERCRMQVGGGKSDGDGSRETKRCREKKGTGTWEATAASLCHPSSAQSKLCRIARKQPLSLFFIKKIRPEDVTGGKAIEHEIIISLGH